MQESITLPNEYKDYRGPMLAMVGNFAEMLDRHLIRIKAEKHRVELTSPEVRLIHSSPYCAGPKVRVFENEDLNEMKKMRVI